MPLRDLLVTIFAPASRIHYVLPADVHDRRSAGEVIGLVARAEVGLLHVVQGAHLGPVDGTTRPKGALLEWAWRVVV